MNAPLPLQGLGVVVTRPHAAGERLAEFLAREGAHPFVFPVMAICPLPASPELDAALAQLRNADLAIFVSANAVEHGLAHARRLDAWPAAARVAAIGEATAQALRNSGFRDVLSPGDRHDSEALLALAALQSVQGWRVVIVRGRGGRGALRETLEARGARVAYAECYERVRPAIDASELLAAWDAGRIHAVSVLSGETLENFVAAIGAGGERFLRSTALVVSHPAIGAHPLAARFARVIVAPPGEPAMARALAALRVTT